MRENLGLFQTRFNDSYYLFALSSSYHVHVIKFELMTPGIKEMPINKICDRAICELANDFKLGKYFATDQKL